LRLNEDGEISNRYLWGPAVDQVLADEQVSSDGQGDYDTDQILWPLGDHQGTVRDLAKVNGSGDTEIVNTYSYDAYGVLLTETAPAVDHLFGFTARPTQTDAGLVNCLNRWYDPIIASWITQDPITFQGGDANLYRYCGNDPVNSVDPSGLFRLFGQEWVMPWSPQASWDIGQNASAYGEAAATAAAGTASGAATGAVAGGLVGGAVGSVAGGVGALPGAGAGATAGGIGGAVSGFIGAALSDGPADAAVRGMRSGYISGVTGGVTGPIAGAIGGSTVGGGTSLTVNGGAAAVAQTGAVVTPAAAHTTAAGVAALSGTAYATGQGGGGDDPGNAREIEELEDQIAELEHRIAEQEYKIDSISGCEYGYGKHDFSKSQQLLQQLLDEMAGLQARLRSLQR